MLPPVSTATPLGVSKVAPAAGPLSPVKEAAPLPAMVRMRPSGVTWRMRLLAEETSLK
jgi:hypothetical protein